MVLGLFRGGSDAPLANVETLFQQMLADNRHSFDMAMAALLGGADPAVIGPDIRATDRRVNEAEQKVRRELVVHASVHGAGVDVGLVLSYMSIVKDIERIGDYAKNLFDIAEDGVDLSAADDLDTFVDLRDRTSALISAAAAAFTDRDAEAARALIEQTEQMRQGFNEAVLAWLDSDAPSRVGVPRVLIHRYLKRIVAHLANALSALVQPVDLLDYTDED